MIQQSHYWEYTWQNYNSKIYMHPNVTAAIFTIAKIWKQPKWSLTDEWIKKMWYMHAME